MKKPVIIGVSALTLLTLSATLFAQTTTGSSLITEMKAGLRDFTLAGQLNPGVSDLKSSPVGGKKTGDMLTAGEYNRILELVGQGGGGGGGAGAVFRVRLANNYNTGDNVPAVVHWDTEDFDEGEQFDMTTHSFKPKSAGYYFLSATVCYEDLNASNGTGSDQVAVFISKNGAASLAEIGVNYFQGTNIVTYNGLTDPCVIVSGVVSSDGDDSFAVRAFQDDVNPTPIRAGSLFSGFQIGGGGGTGTGGGGSGWVDVPLTDTNPFDQQCMYRFVTQGQTYYAETVHEDKLYWINSQHFTKTNKSVLVFGTAPYNTATKMEKLCAGSGSGAGDSSPSGTLCGSLFTQRDGVGGATCTNTQNTVKCAGQTLSMPAACGNTNPCAAMTGCPAGYDPVAVGYSWGGGQTVQTPVYMYNQCSCAKQ